MKKLMQQDPAVLAPIRPEIRIENDQTDANPRRGMRGITRRIAKMIAIADLDRPTLKKRRDFDSLVSH
jgi:hypothetical protein